MRNHSTTARRLALGAASALGLMLGASSIQAQEYGPYGNEGPFYGNGASEEIEVIAPRHRQERSDVTGAPIRDVAISQAVRFDDLDLRTDWGARALKDRIRYTARTMCRQLDFRYPVSTDDSPPCYQTALDDAMPQADAAIAQARGYDDE